MSRFALRARCLFPVDRPPIAHGALTIDGERILAVGEAPEDVPPGGVHDLGNVALLPGLVNAHTHLEFSDLASPLGTHGMPLPEWIGEVVRHRSATQPGVHADAQSPVARGILECSRSGVTALGEIATANWSADEFASPPLCATVFRELIGLTSERSAALPELAAAHFRLAEEIAALWRAGVSPHAPYTVRMETVEQVCRMPESRIVAMHLAESREELQLLAAATGPFLTLLQDRAAWDPTAIRPGTRPLDYLQCLRAAPRALVVHGNYLVRDELALLAEERERMSLVYCPRTHAYFRHERYPLPEALAAGVNVALGTDSRASNPDLDLFAEMQHVAARFPEVPPDDVLRMGTINGAQALGIHAQCGTLTPGKLANLVAVALPDHAAEPYELLYSAAGGLRRTWFRGRQVLA